MVSTANLHPYTAVSAVLPDDALVWVDIFAIQQLPPGEGLPCEHDVSHEELKERSQSDLSMMKHVMRSVDNMVNVLVTRDGALEGTPGWNRAWVATDFERAMVSGLDLALLIGHADAAGDFVPDHNLARQLVGRDACATGSDWPRHVLTTIP